MPHELAVAFVRHPALGSGLFFAGWGASILVTAAGGTVAGVALAGVSFGIGVLWLLAVHNVATVSSGLQVTWRSGLLYWLLILGLPVYSLTIGRPQSFETTDGPSLQLLRQVCAILLVSIYLGCVLMSAERLIRAETLSLKGKPDMVLTNLAMAVPVIGMWILRPRVTALLSRTDRSD